MMENNQKIYESIQLNIADHGHYEFSQVQRSFVPMHWHDAIELIFLLQGELLIETEQRKHQLKPGQCILLNPNALHSTTSLCGNTALLLQFPTDELSFFTSATRSRQFLWNPRTADPLTIKAMERVKQKLLLMKETAESQNIFAPMRMASILLEISYLLYTDFSFPMSNADFNNGEKNRERLSTVFTYTEKHYRENIAISDVAEILCVHPNYFCRFFKQQTSVTYLHYLNEYRLSKIYYDIITTDTPVLHLLEKHGFTNYKMFRRMFAERFHSTPSAVRAQPETNQTQ